MFFKGLTRCIRSWKRTEDTTSEECKEERERSVLSCGEALSISFSNRSKGVAFAQRLILLRVERLPLQVDLAESTDEAGIMPAVAQGLQKAIAGINLEVTAVALGAKHLLIVSLAVGFALLHVKGLIPDGSLAGCTLETLNVVGHLQGMHDFPCDLLLALGAVRGVSVIVTLGAVDRTSLLKEAPLV